MFTDIIAALGGTQVNVEDLPKTDPTAVRGKTCEALFTYGVDTLRSIVPSARVRALAAVIWDLVGHKQVLVAMGPDVPALSFTVMRQKTVDQGLVLIPQDWPAKVDADPFMQLGAILFVGAQVVDFYNDRLVGDPAARIRWEAYEAELLHALAGLLPRWTPNDYQKDAMKRYPRGLDSPGVELYPFRGYEPPRGAA